MAGLNLTPIDAGKGSRTALEDISEEIRETVEEAFTFCQENAQRLQTPAFESKEDAEDWLSEARAYAYQREAGRLVVTGNAAKAPEQAEKDKGMYVARFRVEAYVAPEQG